MPAGNNDDAVTTEADALADICKDPTRPAEPLSADHVRAPDSGMPPVRLQSLRDVQNINALAEGQRLNFLLDGVTIVRQAGGSGRSL
jgi:hypothetical protein